ncbi:MAG: hypothetical protein HY791_00560 [Deltaproteobacteria bacterium]|nr:hypothetical protein [Deltaproteobacteria bacterium]
MPEVSELELDPLVELAASLLVKGGAEPWTYPSSAEETLATALRARAKSQDVAEGVQGLFHAAIALAEDEASPEAAGVILRALHAVRAELELGGASRSALEQQLDAGLSSAIKRAPRAGEKAPEGSVKLGSFPIRRLRG